MQTLILSVVLLGMSSLAQAEKALELPACADIAKQCEAAGYMPGDHKKTGKGLWVDCVGAVAKGKSVTGVTATADQAKACRDAARVKRKARV